MRLLVVLSILCLFVVISGKKHLEENADPIEAESREHGAKKYSKDHQKSHHHGHKHKSSAKELPQEPEAKPKTGPVEIPEPEIELQADIETSKKAVVDQKQKEQTEDLHLQDLTHEENLKKEKKKKRKSHHGAHHAEVLEENNGKHERKLFAEHEAKNPIDEKVIEDSFEPLEVAHPDSEKKNKVEDKKSKGKSKNKKAHEKKDKNNKKAKDGKKKNKDKKQKNKDKKKW